MRRVINLLLAIIVLSVAGQIGFFQHELGSTTAYADDHGGDGDDGGDDGGGDDDSDDGPEPARPERNNPGVTKSQGGKAAKTERRENQQKKTQRKAQQKRVVATRATPLTIVGLDLPEAGVTRLVARGYRIISDRTLISIGTRVTRFAVPRNASLAAARRAILQSGATDAAASVLYRPEAENCDGIGCDVKNAVSWPTSVAGSCTDNVRIGVIDTGFERDHPELVGSAVDYVALTPPKRKPSGKSHGTAVVSLLAGKTVGLLPNSEIILVDPYYSIGKGEDRAELSDVIKALDILAERKPKVINMSLTGPDNRVLDAVLRRLHASGISIVAAAGNNGGQSGALFPAGYEHVIAVTAVDGKLRPWRRAARGRHIDFAAPGVNIDVADGKTGWRKSSGTSFAAPFVAASLALLSNAQRPDKVSALEALANSARDLGKQGRDPVFGWGLVQGNGICDRSIASP